MSRAAYFLHQMESAPDKGDRLEKYQQFIARRSRRIPLQQILGRQEFMGLAFWVNEDVLIPRQDTEILVEQVLAELAKRKKPADRAEEHDSAKAEGRVKVLDMCTGSGCIGISIERISAVPVEVLGIDISEAALRVAQTNRERLGCAHYEIRQSDLFDAVTQKYAFIVSNPPYIPTAVIDTLDEEVRVHEPHLALDGEKDGLAFYRRIAAQAPEYLEENGQIFLEIGYDQGEAVKGLLAESGFAQIRVIQDLAGLDRVVTGLNP